MDEHKLALEWMGLAGDDLSAAQLLAPSEQITDAIVGFHCQQAIEKALKAVLTSLGVGFPKTHDIVLLRDQLAAAGHGLPAELNGIGDLNPYGVALRYGRLQLPPLARDRVLALARGMCAWSKEQIRPA
jgi:HEPN domain